MTPWQTAVKKPGAFESFLLILKRFLKFYPSRTQQGAYTRPAPQWLPERTRKRPEQRSYSQFRPEPHTSAAVYKETNMNEEPAVTLQILKPVSLDVARSIAKQQGST